LHDRLMVMGAELVVKTTEAITTGTARQVSQHELTLPERPLHRAPKIHKEDCRINWQADVGTVHNLVRGLSPYPGAFTEISAGGQKLYLKIFMAEPEYTRPDAGPGSWQTDTKSFMKIAAYDGYLNLQEVQLSGRRPMGITEFLRGFGKVFS